MNDNPVEEIIRMAGEEEHPPRRKKSWTDKVQL